MNIGQHIIFVGSQPKIFKTIRSSQGFKTHYAVNKDKAERLLTSLINSSAHNPVLIYLIVDVQFNQLKEFLSDLIQKKAQSAWINRNVFVRNFIFIPLADLSSPQRSLQTINQVLALAKFNIQAVLTSPINFSLLKQFEGTRG